MDLAATEQTNVTSQLHNPQMLGNNVTYDWFNQRSYFNLQPVVGPHTGRQSEVNASLPTLIQDQEFPPSYSFGTSASNPVNLNHPNDLGQNQGCYVASPGTVFQNSPYSHQPTCLPVRSFSSYQESSEANIGTLMRLNFQTPMKVPPLKTNETQNTAYHFTFEPEDDDKDNEVVNPNTPCSNALDSKTSNVEMEKIKRKRVKKTTGPRKSKRSCLLQTSNSNGSNEKADSVPVDEHEELVASVLADFPDSNHLPQPLSSRQTNIVLPMERKSTVRSSNKTLNSSSIMPKKKKQQGSLETKDVVTSSTKNRKSKLIAKEKILVDQAGMRMRNFTIQKILNVSKRDSDGQEVFLVLWHPSYHLEYDLRSPEFLEALNNGNICKKVFEEGDICMEDAGQKNRKFKIKQILEVEKRRSDGKVSYKVQWYPSYHLKDELDSREFDLALQKYYKCQRQ